MNQRPHRAYELDIHIGGDKWEDVLADLRELWQHVADHGTACNSVMGGPSCGHTVTIRVDESMTHDRYHEALSAYLDRPSPAAAEGSGA